MRRLAILLALTPAILSGCAKQHGTTTAGTLAELHSRTPDVQEVEVEQGLEQAMQGYRRFLEDTPETAMTPEAIRRLADLQIEKQFGIRAGDGKPREMAAPEPPQRKSGGPPAPTEADSFDDTRESDRDFEARTTGANGVLARSEGQADPAGALEAIALYDRLLTEYPSYEHNDRVLYQKARAFGELGRTEEAMETMDLLIRTNPHSEHSDEVQFRRGEYFFTRRGYRDAESAYSAVIDLGKDSSYYELALYKLGWTLYKQEFYEEALHRFMALLDYKVSIGYDFDQEHSEEDERRVADTYRVISLSFNNLGGPGTVPEYFASFGNRSYEDHIYANLGDHYLDKLRYDDAAKAFKAFVSLYPFHRAAPQFSMRVVDTFTKGGFPKLVLESKREFASRYGLQAEYWRHFRPEDSPEVLAYLKANLRDLATHYHAEYQNAEVAEEKLAGYREALHWYAEYLKSFPADSESPSINYELADLLLENEDYGEAARQYERTAYEYPAHAQSAAAGYAAVYAFRQELEASNDETRDAVKRDTVASSLRFADAFPEHEDAPAILGAAADDLYEMGDHAAAVAAAQRLLETYAAADRSVRRAAWIVVGHGSFDLADYPRAEQAYVRVVDLTASEDESRPALVENLAASIYKQGEIANEAKNYRAAADHFLRIRSAAPTSKIRANAEYDAGAALIELQAWTEAAGVLETFRGDYPEHELNVEATRLIAYAYKENGDSLRAADEYEALASQSDDPALRSDALLVAGDLYEQSGAPRRALQAYGRYVEEFPTPVEPALETRFKIAEIHKAERDEALYREQLEAIIRIDADSGLERTPRTRTLAARSALVLAEGLYREFVAARLSQPFESSLQEKNRLMEGVMDAMNRLVSYEIAEITAAATYYLAESYQDFSRALAESERPVDLQPAELAEYELALEEEAFPFEEKAIEFHEKNLELLQAGVFNPWTEKSLGELAALVPGRYAKAEMSTGFLGTLDRYVYRSPASRMSSPVAGLVEAAPTATER